MNAVTTITSSFFGAFLAFLSLACCSLSWAAQEKTHPTRLGPAVRAEYESAGQKFLPLTSGQPPRELLSQAEEVIVISGYEPSEVNKRGTTVKVKLDRPGLKVLLILSSHESVFWQVTATPETSLVGIIAGSGRAEQPALAANVETKGFEAQLDYIAETDDASFIALASRLHRLFGIRKIDTFRSSHTLPAEMAITSAGPPRAGWAVGFLEPQHGPPPRALARSIDEVFVVSGNGPANAGQQGVHVTLDRPGQRVLLVLSSYQAVHWRISATPTTQLVAILQGAYEESSVSSDSEALVFLAELPEATCAESAGFAALLSQLNNILGLQKVDALRAGYVIPSEVLIKEPDPASDELTLAGPAPEKPENNFVFSLTTSHFEKIPWSLTGRDDAARAEETLQLCEKTALLSPDEQYLYKIQENGRMTVSNPQGIVIGAAQLPPNFPRFSWASALAYDTKRDIIGVIAEGFLYRFSVKEARWLDFRELPNIEPQALAYDQRTDCYIGWGHSAGGQLFFIPGDGATLTAKDVTGRLPGFGRLYDQENSPAPELMLFPHGRDIALVYFHGGAVRNIWCYNTASEQAKLTYKAPQESGQTN